VPPAYYYEEVHRSDGWKRAVLMFLGLAVLLVALGALAWTFYDSLGLDENNGPAAPATPESAVLVEVPSDHGPFGARGVGEPPVVPTAAAIANAIADACGARPTELPMTPPRVLEALNGTR